MSLHCVTFKNDKSLIYIDYNDLQIYDLLSLRINIIMKRKHSLKVPFTIGTIQPDFQSNFSSAQLHRHRISRKGCIALACRFDILIVIFVTLDVTVVGNFTTIPGLEYNRHISV